MLKKSLLLVLGIVLIFTLTGCSGEEAANLTLATTTSTEDSGLLDELLPIFEDETGYEVDVIAVGTGQALQTGRSGDADILLVHARELEEQFVAEGYGTERFSVMHNDFVVLGPSESSTESSTESSMDPAGVLEAGDLDEAMNAIYRAGEAGDASFASRGDESGTHAKEMELWESFQLDIDGQEWYDSLGQGMGDTLITANEMGTYTLADRGTFLSMEDRLDHLEIVYEGSDKLANPYGLIPVNPETHENVEYEGAAELVEFFVRDDIQEKISKFGIDEYGEPLFSPAAEK